MTAPNDRSGASEPKAPESDFAELLQAEQGPFGRYVDCVEAVRLRPAMYVGSTGFFGFIHYLVCPVALLLEQHPTRIALSAEDGAYHIESDVVVPMEQSAEGRLVPFEDNKKLGNGLGFEGSILNALSEYLSVEIRQGTRCETLEYRRGRRVAHEKTQVSTNGQQTTMRFVPDTMILTFTTISPAIFTSYLRRLSFLHPRTRFTLAAGNKSMEFRSERGLVDLFESVSAPYQFLHEPVHIAGQEAAAKLEAVFAFHSSRENALWCFINNGRVIEGGTHERGFADAIDQLYVKLKLPRMKKRSRNGVVGVFSLEYPDVVWEGCIKLIVGNPELRPLVRDWVVRETLEWVRMRPGVAEQLKHLQTFQFPEVWSR
jgi:DNA gyrase subunit B